MAFAQTAQGALHYEVVEQTAPWQARGLPILFHHGIGSSSMLWRGWYPALIDRYPLAIFDMRGCGRSHIPGADFDWSLDLMVEDLFAVADATLTVSNGAHLGATIGRVHAWKKQLDEGGSAGWSKAFMPDRFHADGLSRERWDWFEAQQAEWPRDSILEALGVLIGTDLTPRLGEIGCPALLLHPDGSPFIPVPVMAELHKLLPDAALNVIGPARHGLPFSHASQCATLLRTFLDSRGAG